MRFVKIIMAFTAMTMFMPVQQGKAQSLKEILNSEAAKKALNTVKQLNQLKLEDLQGTWQYKGSACQFKSDDLLQKAGGIAMAEGLEKKLDNAYAKVGIVPDKFTYTFNSDSTFTSEIGKKKMKGTYSYDAASGVLVLKYFSLLTSEAQVVKAGDTIALLFDADRLLKLVSLLSNYSKNATLASVGKVAGQYDGLMLGFDMAK